MRATTDATTGRPAPAAVMPPALADWLSSFNELVAELKARDGYTRTPTVVREGLALLTATFVTDRPQVGRVIDDLVQGPDFAVPIRVYHPQPDTASPLLVFVHGGGHVAGGISVYDAITRKLAVATNQIVVSVDYRLAPECPYPAGVQDVISVIKGMQPVLAAREIRFLSQVSLVGDSAGGALCATASHMLRYEPMVEVNAQVLIYPSLDYTLSQPSASKFAKGYLLERERVAWYFDQYFHNAENRRDVSPLFMPCADDLPRTLVLTAGNCVLHDEGVAYVKRLQESGVDVEHLDFPGMIHAFLNLEDLVPVQCADVYRRIAGFLGR